MAAKVLKAPTPLSAVPVTTPSLAMLNSAPKARAAATISSSAERATIPSTATPAASKDSNGSPINGGEGGQCLIVGGADSGTIYASQWKNGAEGGQSSILVAGHTTLDEAGLEAVLAEWTSSRSFDDKVANIAGTGVGPRGNGDSYLQVGVTLFNDHVADQLFGDSNSAAYWLLDTAGSDTSQRVKPIDRHSDVQVVENPFSSSSLGSYDFSGSSVKVRDKVVGDLTINDSDWVLEGAQVTNAVVTIGSGARMTITSGCNERRLAECRDVHRCR